jgi:molybdate transport system ATP-binding protein
MTVPSHSLQAPRSLEISARRTLAGFSLDVDFHSGGGITALFGRSGAGKTSVINMIAGLLRPDAGRIAIDGAPLFDSHEGINVPTEQRRLGYVFQDPRLFPHMNVERNLKFGTRYAPPNPAITFDQVVALLGLSALLSRRPASLSGGERQRVAIGRALLANPRLLLMDEPLANLDPERRDEVLSFVEQLHDAVQVPIIYVSHNMEEIIRLADTSVLIADGRVAASGPVEEVMSRLDLGPITGRHNAGTVMKAEVDSHDVDYRLTCLRVPGGKLWVSQLEMSPGTALRVRVRARDVSLSLDPPQRISIRNIFEGTIAEIQNVDDDPEVNIRLALEDGGRLWARITQRALADLELKPGLKVYALAKSVALDSRALGHRAAVTRFREI